MQSNKLTTKELCDHVRKYTDKLIRSALSKDLEILAAKHSSKSPLPPLCEMNFKDMRESKGLTLRQVEKLIGISNSYLSQLETGNVANPSYNTVKKLYDLYTIKDTRDRVAD